MGHPFRKLIGRNILPITLTISLATSLTMALPTAAQQRVVGTVYQTTNVRSGPGTQYAIVGQLGEGDQVVVLGRDTSARWLQIDAVPDMMGWLPAFSLLLEVEIDGLDIVEPGSETTPEVESHVTVESYGRVNVRSGPGIDYAIVGQLDVGERVEATARSNHANDWLLVELADKSEGWVAYFTVQVTGDPEALPVLTPDATGQTLVEPTALAQTRFNVRLHLDPSLESPVVAVIPFSHTVTPLARTAQGDWVLVAYQDLTGWGAARLFSMDDVRFNDLPVQGR